MRSSLLDQANPQGASSGAASISGANSSVLSSLSGLNALEDPVTVLDRLIALSATGLDIDKFWAALGEAYDDECGQIGAGGDHCSGVDDLSERGEDALSEVMSAGIQGRQRRGNARGELHPLSSSVPGLGDHYPPMLESHASQTLYHSNMFIPPSRVPSVGPGPTSAHVLPTGAQLPEPHASQWTTAPPWDAESSPWTAHEGIDPQLWLRETSQGNPPYGWGGDRRY
jgi:hypothetical protein